MNRILFLLIIPFLACSNTEIVQTQNTSPQDEPEVSTVSPEPEPGVSEEANEGSYRYLSSLSDTYFNRTNEIPEEYAELKVVTIEEPDEEDLFEGYRVQIYSGQDVALADTAAKHFRSWSSMYIEGYQAETYTFFKAPFYRVHVGDFHNRERALEFSNLLKRRFRDSWVVYDRVIPWNVPP
ncbi:MAG: SPOR domain-containing protein, partial [Balneolales bacterium]|nr:SPOR domain-containing protein [Balneolales bacterium]